VGGSATVTVDTLPTHGTSTSSLDPQFRVYYDAFSYISYIATADDEIPCSTPSACGFACPQKTFNCAGEGEYTIMVLTARTSVAGCSDTEGFYNLRVEVFEGPMGSGPPLSVSEVHLGGQEPRRGYAWGWVPSGPAADDAHFDGNSTPSASALNPAPLREGIEGPGPLQDKTPVSD
jgi:hypothetical protein